MQCPFPGMDPYIERPAIWPDFHDSFVAALKAALQPLLRPKYVALMQDRLYVVEAEQVRKPDVAIVRTPAREFPSGGAAVLEMEEVDEPAIFERYREEFREPVIEIIEPAAGNRLVTAIEVLSPENKRPGAGRNSYLTKREQYRQAEANLVEIDLLRGGQHTVEPTAEELESLQPWRYLVAVLRYPSTHEVYAFPLERRLPRIKIPLAYEDPDVRLDLQAVFTRCWSEGAYPELLHYDAPPPGTLTDDELRWCRTRLRAAGFAADTSAS